MKCKHTNVRITEMISHSLFRGSKYTSKLERVRGNYIRYECRDCGKNSYERKDNVESLPKWVRKRIDILNRDNIIIFNL